MTNGNPGNTATGSSFNSPGFFGQDQEQGRTKEKEATVSSRFLLQIRTDSNQSIMLFSVTLGRMAAATLAGWV